jgi:hypothetical protein
MELKRTYAPPKLSSEKIFLPALSGTTGPNPKGGYGGFNRPPGK